MKEWSKAGIVVVALLAAGAVFIWSIDPPWRVSELHGSVINSGTLQTPNVAIRYYKMTLLVKTDDGRNVAVSSERRVPPSVGERITIQERVGFLGTQSFIEIPTQ